MRHRVLKLLENVGIAAFVALLIVWSLLPIVWNFLTSIKQRVDLFAIPPRLLFEPTWEFYAAILRPGSRSIYPFLTNTVIVAAGTTVLTLFLAALAAYALSRYTFKGRRVLLYSVLATRLLPPISAVVPLFLLLNTFRLIDTHLALVLIYSALGVPFSVWLMKSFFDTVPKDIEESAMIEGCNRLQTLWYITLPLAAPGLVATGVFVLIMAWNEFMFAFMFTSVEAKTLPVLISESRGEDQFLWQSMAATTTVLMLPPLFLGWYLQRYLTRGLTAGALK
jgi:multiple sugar transport system permease protein